MLFFLLPLILTGAWVYIWRRLIVTAKLSPIRQRILTDLLVFLLIIQLATPFLMRHSREIRHPYNFLILSYAMLGFVDLLLFFTLAKDVLSLFLRIFPKNKEDESRRLFI